MPPEAFLFTIKVGGNWRKIVIDLWLINTQIRNQKVIYKTEQLYLLVFHLYLSVLLVLTQFILG